VFDLSKSSGVERQRRENRGDEGKSCGEGVSPFLPGEGPEERAPQTAQYFFHFKIVHSGAFLYTNSKVLFAIKCRERYVITVFLATDGDTDMKTSSFNQSRKLIPIQSVNSNSRRFHSYSRHVLWA